MATNEIRIGMQFADETKKTYVIPDLPDGSTKLLAGRVAQIHWLHSSGKP